MRLAYQLGVRIGVGCDYPGNPRGWEVGDRTLYELQELVRCGLTPTEALLGATRINAEAYGKHDDLGTLAPGKRADVLVVAGDPLEDISVLYDQANLCLVLKDGAVEYAREDYKSHYCISDR